MTVRNLLSDTSLEDIMLVEKKVMVSIEGYEAKTYHQSGPKKGEEINILSSNIQAGRVVESGRFYEDSKIVYYFKPNEILFFEVDEGVKVCINDTSYIILDVDKVLFRKIK